MLVKQGIWSLPVRTLKQTASSLRCPSLTYTDQRHLLCELSCKLVWEFLLQGYFCKSLAKIWEDKLFPSHLRDIMQNNLGFGNLEKPKVLDVDRTERTTPLLCKQYLESQEIVLINNLQNMQSVTAKHLSWPMKRAFSVTTAFLQYSVNNWVDCSQLWIHLACFHESLCHLVSE